MLAITTEPVACAQTGVELQISTALPARYNPAETTPLIVCMDGLWTLGAMSDAVRIMSMSGEAPEAIVVGVSFAERRMSEYLRQRARWFSPTQWEPPEASGVKGLAAQECGRGAEHMRFVADQLLPALAAEHSLSERWFFGHSFSALFGLRMLLDTPSLFDGWILASPSIWWDNRAILDIEQTNVDQSQALPRVFVTTGELETDAHLLADLAEKQPDGYDPDALEDPAGYFNMADNAADLVALLIKRGYPAANVIRQVLAGESHSSTIGAAISAGLRALQPDSAKG